MSTGGVRDSRGEDAQGRGREVWGDSSLALLCLSFDFPFVVIVYWFSLFLSDPPPLDTPDPSPVVWCACGYVFLSDRTAPPHQNEPTRAKTAPTLPRPTLHAV